MSEADAALYEQPFEYVRQHVRAERLKNNREAYRRYWWRFAEPRPALRAAVSALPRFIATVAHSKHRFFVWLPATTSPDQALIAIARADDATLGVLHSRFHELWSLRLGTSLEDRPRYTPSTCFETFPFPSGLTPADTARQQTEQLADGPMIPAGLPAAARSHAQNIASAAFRLVALRNAWLNPPEWTIATGEVVPIGMTASPYPERLMARAGFEESLAKRTLTNLYNLRPAWLERAHRALDAAVAASYGWADYSPEFTDDEILRRLLSENKQRAQRQSGSQLEIPLLGIVRDSTKRHAGMKHSKEEAASSRDAPSRRARSSK